MAQDGKGEGLLHARQAGEFVHHQAGEAFAGAEHLRDAVRGARQDVGEDAVGPAGQGRRGEALPAGCAAHPDDRAAAAYRHGSDPYQAGLQETGAPADNGAFGLAEGRRDAVPGGPAVDLEGADDAAVQRIRHGAGRR